jgi:hypothetical protein
VRSRRFRCLNSHVLPSRQAQAASTLDAAIGCQDENDAVDQRQEIEESLGKEVSREGIEPSTRRLRVRPETRNEAHFQAFSRVGLAECGKAQQIDATPAQPSWRGYR